MHKIIQKDCTIFAFYIWITTQSPNQCFVAFDLFGFRVVVVVFEVSFAFGAQYGCEVVLPYLNFGYERRFDCTIPTPNGLI